MRIAVSIVFSIITTLSATSQVDFDKLVKKSKFVDGYYIKGTDTVFSKILKLKGSNKGYLNSFLLVSDDNGKSLVLKADSVNEYVFENRHFYKFSNKEQCFFIEKIIDGKATLYQREAIDSDPRFLYYIKMPNITSLYIVSPYDQNVFITDANASSSSSGEKSNTTFYTRQINDKFKLAFSQIFSDCVGLRNMILSEMLTINDIPMIVNTYNNCKK